MAVSGETEISTEVLLGSSQATVDKLKAAGLVTLLQVAVTPPLEIVAKTEIKTLDTAKKAWMSAQKALNIFRNAEELYLEQQAKKMQKLTTGVKTLDELIGGGYERGIITEIIGGFGSGKTQLCFMASVLAQLPEDQGGLDAKTLFFDTEETFMPERIIEIAEGQGLDPNETMRNITVVQVFNTEHLKVLIQNISEELQTGNYGVLVVDSMIGHFRSEFFGRGTLANRQQILAGILGDILRTAKSFNLVTLLTNQVIANVTGYGPKENPAGGNIMAHAGTIRLKLRTGRTNIRIAQLIDSSWLPPGEAPFKITEKGVEDTGE